MSVRRAAAFALALCALGVAGVALPWFRVARPDREITFGAPDVAAGLWLVAPAAVGIALLVLVGARHGHLTDRVAWRALLSAALLAATVSLTCLIVMIAPAVSAQARGVAQAPLVPVDRLPAGFVTAGAFAGLAALLLSWLIGLANAVQEGDRTSGPDHSTR